MSTNKIAPGTMNFGKPIITKHVFGEIAHEADNIDSKIKKARDKIDTVAKNTELNEANLANLSSAILKGFDPSGVAMPDIAQQNNINNSENIITLKGNSEKSKALKGVIKKEIEKAARSVIMNTPSGVYKTIIDARTNVFIGVNMPVMRQSVKLFIDDLNNGSYRGESGFNRMGRYKFYNNGVPVTDIQQIEKAMEILEPTGLDMATRALKPISSIEIDSDTVAHIDGRSLTWSIQHKEIAKTMHIKYILSQAKKNKGKNKTVDITKNVITTEEYHVPNSYDDLLDILLILQKKPEDYDSNKSLEDNFGFESVHSLDSNYLKKETRTYKLDKNGKKVELTPYEVNEYNRTDESFPEFCYRMLVQSQNTPVYMGYDTEIEKTIHFQYHNASLPEKIGMEVFNEMFNKSSVISDVISNESVEIATEAFINRLGSDDLEELEEISFEDIYSYNPRRLKKLTTNPSDEYSFESLSEREILRSNPSDTIDRLFVKAFRSEVLDPTFEITTEELSDPTFFDEKLKDFVTEFAYEWGEATDDVIQDTNQLTLPAITKLENEVSAEKKLYSRLERIYGGIKGETIEILDNTRTIPIMGADRLMGAFYMEYTHRDVQHLVSVRTILGNPTSYQSNMDFLAIDSEEQEETLGRMIFSDLLKPIIEKNMDSRFLKDNQDALYTLKRLMEENELSNSMTMNDVTRYGNYNLAKVIFIPASELIFKRNGDSGLGESSFQASLVPALAYILAREAHLGYIMQDGKGISFLVLPRGVADSPNEFGEYSLPDTIRNLTANRQDLRDLGTINFPISHRFVTLVKDPEVAMPIELHDVTYPPFQLDPELLNGWKEEATAGCGYPSSSFETNKGSVPELARKTYEINNTIILQMEAQQRRKVVPSSQLATKCLRDRGGEVYKGWTAVWCPPPLKRGNVITLTENLKEKSDAIQALMDFMQGMFEYKDNWKEVKDFLLPHIVKYVCSNDPLISDCESLWNKAEAECNAKIAEDTEEVADTEDDAQQAG